MKAGTLLILVAALLTSGCGTYRGIPTHGGGKRFDEEQRIVAGAIRQAVGDMVLKELSAKRLQIVMDCISHDGGGSITWPGLQGINATANFSHNVEGNWDANDGRTTEVLGAGGGVSIQPNPVFFPAVFPTQPDAAYLRATVEMKARHDGIIVTDAQPDAVLFLLVDVLGTNRSRTDNILVVDEDYKASCELTYYAVDTRTGQLLFRARQSGAEARYDERHTLGVTRIKVKRGIAPLEPSIPLVDKVAAAKTPTTQPARETAAAPTTQPAVGVAPAAYQATIQPLVAPSPPAEAK
jgi:hypothetical protein